MKPEIPNFMTEFHSTLPWAGWIYIYIPRYFSLRCVIIKRSNSLTTKIFLHFNFVESRILRFYLFILFMLLVHSQSGQQQLHSSYAFVRLSAWNSATLTGNIFLKFRIPSVDWSLFLNVMALHDGSFGVPRYFVRLFYVCSSACKVGIISWCHFCSLY